MYRIVGADQREYGPVSAEEIRQWIKEGRANAASIARFEQNPWKPLSTFPEFTADLTQASPPPAPVSQFRTNPPLYGAPSSPGHHPLAITGLILSCLGLLPCCCFSWLFAISGGVLSAVALHQISREPDRWDGKTLAIAGIVIALLSFVLGALLLIFQGTWQLGSGVFRNR